MLLKREIVGMKILLLGKNGQVGRKLSTQLLHLGEVRALCSKDLDFRDSSAVRQCIREYKPNWVVNAAAYTNVEGAEDNIDDAFSINAHAVNVISEEVKALNSWLVHYSTDYVFDGAKTTPYTEKDHRKPISVYGASKAMGDEFIKQSGCNHIILRSSWVFSEYGNNFVKTILHLAQTRPHLNIINDQIGCPTSASLIANVTSNIIHHISSTNFDIKYNGIYNMTSNQPVSWYEFACQILKYAESIGVELQRKDVDIKPITTAEYITKAKRPLNSILDISKIEEKFGMQMPHWQIFMQETVDSLHRERFI